MMVATLMVLTAGLVAIVLAAVSLGDSGGDSSPAPAVEQGRLVGTGTEIGPAREERAEGDCEGTPEGSGERVRTTIGDDGDVSVEVRCQGQGDVTAEGTARSRDGDARACVSSSSETGGADAHATAVARGSGRATAQASATSGATQAESPAVRSCG